VKAVLRRMCVLDSEVPAKESKWFLDISLYGHDNNHQ